MRSAVLTETLLDRGQYGDWAVIAGGSDGTGACFAREIAAAGINLLLVARRKAMLDALTAELRAAHGVEVRTLVQDLNAPDAAAQMARATEGLRVGLYISNAGAESGGHAFLDTPLTTINELIARNCITVSAACHHFGNLMRARGRGGIVLMGSGAGLGGQPGVAAYSGVKGFVLNFAESLWAELCGHGVHVIGIAAPIMETPTLRRTLGDMKIPGIVPAEEVVRTTLQRLPEGCSYVYAFGEPPEANEQQTALRRERVIAVERISQALFS
jgi:short-subunit dehydrogenase